MTPYTIVMIVLTVIIISLYVIRAVLGTYYRNRLVICVSQCNLDAYDKLAAKKAVRLLVPPFNLHYMRLNLYMMQKNEQKIDEEFDILLEMKTGKLMRQEIVLKAFYYYVKLKSGKRCQPLLEELHTFANEDTKKECDILYDIYVLKKSNHIGELLENIEELPLEQRAINEYLVSLQYLNQNKPDLAKEHEERSTAYLEESLKESA